tara:strand:+ start:5614 stop:5772 length:159 start_codon:yes stop_codon:yes gene_type:complete
MSAFETFAYLGSIVMVVVGICVAMHAYKTTRYADRRDPDRVKRVIDELNKPS